MTPANETFDATSSDSQWLEAHAHLVCLLLIIEGEDSQWNGRKWLSSEE
jgi:hypothetical protein